ncbi:MAG: histidine kinase [Limisphaerales bacterium]
MPLADSSPNLLRRLARLQSRLSEVEDTLGAIRSGSVDALVVRTPRGEQLFTLRGADQTYRTLVEAMNEGALTLNHEIISYCNHQFARMVKSPLEKIFGTPASAWIHSLEFPGLLKTIRKGARERHNIEAVLRAANGTEVPVLASASRFSTDGKAAVCLVVTDITDRKRAERARHEMSRRILNAQELERQRVARDLHDGVNQLLSSAKYRLSTAAHQSTVSARESVEQARMLLEKAIAEVRSICRNLRPSELDDLGLLAALRSLTHELLRAIQAVVQGEAFFSPRISRMILQDAVIGAGGGSEATTQKLSARKTDVLRAIAQGNTSKEVASLLKLSVRTVETYRVRVKRKLTARNTAEMLKCARERGLI